MLMNKLDCCGGYIGTETGGIVNQTRFGTDGARSLVGSYVVMYTCVHNLRKIP
jgi:hypothetical protein